MTELDKILAAMGRMTYANGVFSDKKMSIKLGKSRPQINGLMVDLHGLNHMPTGAYVCATTGGLLQPGKERLRLLRELGALLLKTLHHVKTTYDIEEASKTDRAMKRIWRHGEVTCPLHPNVEAFVAMVLAHKVRPDQLQYDRGLRAIRQTFADLRANISFEEVARIWNEVMIEKIHDA